MLLDNNKYKNKLEITAFKHNLILCEKTCSVRHNLSHNQKLLIFFYARLPVMHFFRALFNVQNTIFTDDNSKQNVLLFETLWLNG